MNPEAQLYTRTEWKDKDSRLQAAIFPLPVPTVSSNNHHTYREIHARQANRSRQPPGRLRGSPARPQPPPATKPVIPSKSNVLPAATASGCRFRPSPQESSFLATAATASFPSQRARCVNCCGRSTRTCAPPTICRSFYDRPCAARRRNTMPAKTAKRRVDTADVRWR